jgi:hypothetical protein
MRKSTKYTPLTPAEQAERAEYRRLQEQAKKLDRAKSATTTTAVRAELNALLRKYGDTFIAATVRLTDAENSYQYLEVERGWASGCTLNARLDTTGSYRENTVEETLEDGTLVSYAFVKLVIDLSWASTGRSIEQAQAAVDIYTRMLAIARELESYFSRRDIVSVYVHKSPVQA